MTPKAHASARIAVLVALVAAGGPATAARA